MIKKESLYCLKNILLQYQTENKEALYCDGPFGDGIDRQCLDACSNAFTERDKLVDTLGNYVFDYVEQM